MTTHRFGLLCGVENSSWLQSFNIKLDKVSDLCFVISPRDGLTPEK